MLLFYQTFIVLLIASFDGVRGLSFITEQNKTTEAFAGTNQTFSWNFSLEAKEKSKEIQVQFGHWDTSHATVIYYLSTVVRESSGNETEIPNNEHAVGRRLYWVGNLTRNFCYAAFRLTNIQHSDSRDYGIRIRVDGLPPYVYEKSFTLTVKDPPPLPTKAPVPQNVTLEIYEGDQLNITCRARMESSSLVVWYKDGHFVQSSERDVLIIKSVNRSQAGSYICVAQGPSGNHTSPITTIKVFFKPTILLPTRYVTVDLFKGNSSTLKCSAKSNPPPTFTWRRGHTEIHEGYDSTENSSVLIITAHNDEDFTTYHCTAKNRVGWDAVTFLLQDAEATTVSSLMTTQDSPVQPTQETQPQPREVYNPDSRADQITLYLSLAAVLAVFVIGFCLVHRYLTKRCRRQIHHTGGEADGTNVQSLQMVSLEPNHAGARFTAVNPSFSGDLEIPRASLNIEKVIGRGAFGVVSRAFALNLPDKPGWTLVAVKSVLEDASEKEKRDLLSEMYVLQQLDPHPHVIQLFGYVTGQERPLVVVEYAQHGDVLGYLRKSRGVQDNYYSDPSVKPHTSLTSKRLLMFTWEISDGMDYLSSKKIIHRDLAARNVLVGESEVCKITDFGMARDVHEEDIYVRTTEGRLPIKWTAPEALFGSGSYTTASDVWSFGVVLYEVFTVGGDPFPGVYMRDIPAMLQNGYRMPRPRFINRALYNIMRDCWRDNPADRPTFEQLRSILGNLLEDERQEYVNLKEIFYENAVPGDH